MARGLRQILQGNRIIVQKPVIVERFGSAGMILPGYTVSPRDAGSLMTLVGNFDQISVRMSVSVTKPANSSNLVT